jgi:hypothetical protein
MKNFDYLIIYGFRKINKYSACNMKQPVFKKNASTKHYKFKNKIFGYKYRLSRMKFFKLKPQNEKKREKKRIKNEL